MRNQNHLRADQDSEDDVTEDPVAQNQAPQDRAVEDRAAQDVVALGLTAHRIHIHLRDDFRRASAGLSPAPAR